jgi:hypothetical protein
MRSLDEKTYQSYPDDFDIIKVKTTGTSAAGEVIKKNTIFICVAKGTPSGFPDDITAGATIYTADQEYTMKTGDNVTILGYKRNYVGIEILNQPTFADDVTSIMVNNVGKNLSDLNDIDTAMSILANFTKIQIPATSTDMIILAYK